MGRFTILVLALVFALPFSAKAQEKDAKTLAQEILDKGAALFDTRDATAMAATYTEDAQIQSIAKDDSTGEIKVEVKKGRSEIESTYRDVFKDAKEKTTSKNTVEFARFVTPDMMIVQGVFQPNVADKGKFPFVQLRVKQGDKWFMKNLQIFLISLES
ncbi:MAG: hypothetical protein ACHRXM_31765 [Isosphaerales bacterium]